jgi:hypothetical protein
MAIIKKIFLASSEELQEDRRAFEIMLARLNPQWRSREITFEIVVWENFIDAMSKEGLQQEYNKAIQDCDVFVMLFFTKVGPYTLEEFETAFADLKAGTGPKIYTYFRNDFILTGNLDENVRGLLDFKARLHELKHYPTLYRNTEDLQWQFSRQLEMLYGGDGATGTEVSDSTPQSKVGEIALVLSHRQLFGDGAPAPPITHDSPTPCGAPVDRYGMPSSTWRKTCAARPGSPTSTGWSARFRSSRHSFRQIQSGTSLTVISVMR